MIRLLKELDSEIDHLELTLVDPDEPSDARIIDSYDLTGAEEFTPIWEDSYQLAIPRAFSLSAKDQIEPEDLRNLPFINRSPCSAQNELTQILDKRDIVYETRANIRSVEYAYSLVSAGVGVAFLPNWGEINNHEDVVMREINGVTVQRTIGLSYKRCNAESRLLIKSKEICRSIREIEH